MKPSAGESVQAVADALNRTIEAAATLTQCALHTWHVINQARTGAKS